MTTLGNPTGGTMAATAALDADKIPIVDNAAGATDSANKTITVLELAKRLGDGVQDTHDADYTGVLGDANKTFYRTNGDSTARTWTIPANGSVAYRVGTTLCFINDGSAGNVSIAITTDTMVLGNSTTTGTRTLAPQGMAVARKVTSTRWLIYGSGLT